MLDERRTIQDYTPEAFERVRRTVIHVATVLGDWMEHVPLIGGAAPSLLIPQGSSDGAIEPHPGTVDVDPGLELMVLEEKGFASIADLLRKAGYPAEENEEDRIRRQTWRSDPALGTPITIDLLMPFSRPPGSGARPLAYPSRYCGILAALALAAAPARSAGVSTNDGFRLEMRGSDDALLAATHRAELSSFHHPRSWLAARRV